LVYLSLQVCQFGEYELEQKKLQYIPQKKKLYYDEYGGYNIVKTYIYMMIKRTESKVFFIYLLFLIIIITINNSKNFNIYNFFKLIFSVEWELGDIEDNIDFLDIHPSVTNIPPDIKLLVLLLLLLLLLLLYLLYFCICYIEIYYDGFSVAEVTLDYIITSYKYPIPSLIITNKAEFEDNGRIVEWIGATWEKEKYEVFIK
jgi:hypothetical protein